MNEYDYTRKDFREIKDKNGKKKYYIRIKSNYIEIPKDVYYVYKNEYKRIKYKQEKNYNNLIINYKEIDKITKYSNFYEYNGEYKFIEEFYKKELIDKMMSFLNCLNEEDYRIIHALFFEEISVTSLAKQLGISKQSLNYRKNKILLFLRNLLQSLN